MKKIPEKEWITRRWSYFEEGIEISPEGIRFFQVETVPGSGGAGPWRSFADFEKNPGWGRLSPDHSAVIEILEILKEARS